MATETKQTSEEEEEMITIQLAGVGAKNSKGSFEINLNWTVSDLLSDISNKCNASVEDIKLICKGKILNQKNASKSLKSLKIKQNDKIILVSSNKSKLKKQKNAKSANPKKSNHCNEEKKNDNTVDNAIERRKNIEEIKAAAEKLAKRDNDGYDWNANYYLELANQNGQKIHLPNDQRQALTVGLTLHEKGKKFMKQKQYTDAIYIMNLAFECFSKVSPETLQIVDNYGLLALDIVWCYYLDQNDKDLRDAGKWLQIAECGLHRAHGKNQERLKQIRAQQYGDFVPEYSLYVRFYVLKAFAYFYVSDLEMAQTMLTKAEIEMRKLDICDTDLVTLQSMGFSHKESRRALRFCGGNIQNAVTQIHKKREDEKAKAEAEKQRMRDRALQRKYGLTKEGKFVNLERLDQLIGMGVDKEIAIEALRQTDNGQEALSLCTKPDKRELLAQNLFCRFFNDKQWYKIEQILDVFGMNVSESRVRAALFLSFGEVESAINLLSDPSPNDVIDLDRIEARFVPYVQQRAQRLMAMQMISSKEIQKKIEQNEKMMDLDLDLDNENDENMEIMDAEMKNAEDEIVQEMEIKSEAMPNPNVEFNGNQNDNVKLVDKFDAIQNNFANDDDNDKIEKHLLDDLDNDDESYLDIDLSKEKEALNNLKALLSSMQMNGSTQQSFLSLFNNKKD